MGNNDIIHHISKFAVLSGITGRMEKTMKNIIKTTKDITKKLDALRLTRATSVSITDKTMTKLAIDNIASGELESLTLFETDTEDGTTTQAVFETARGFYSTCSSVVSDYVSEIIDLINSGDITADELNITFGFATSRNGNKYVAMNI